MNLQLTDVEAKQLIKMLKDVLQAHEKTLHERDSGKFMLQSNQSDGKRKFQVNYFYATDDIHLNLIDYKTKHTLVRINLDSRFHNNSNGKVYGHRIEIFSEQEFIKKNDGVTQVKAYKLPIFGLRDTNDFIQALNEFLKYINVHSTDKIKISIEAPLDI